MAVTPYCTSDDISDELRNLTQLVPAGKDMDTWVSGRIKRADAYINTRLARRYADYIPFTTVPEMVWSLSIGLTCYYVLLSNYAGQAVEKLEAIKAAYWTPNVEVLNWLSKGNLELYEVDTGTLTIDSSTDEYQREFRLKREDTEGTELVEGSMEDW